MAANKTKETGASVDGYLAAISDEARRKDCEALARLMAKATKHPPKMWGSSIVGFGSYHYKYESGREGDMCLVGFSSRKSDISLYGLNAASAKSYVRHPLRPTPMTPTRIAITMLALSAAVATTAAGGPTTYYLDGANGDDVRA